MHTIKQNLVHKKIKTFKNKKILITEQERFKGSWFFCGYHYLKLN